jgi:voltage-gated potassium channel
MLSVERRAQAFDSVERATDLPMMILSLALVPLIVIPMLVAIPESAEPAILAAEWLIWGAFAAELMVKTYLAPNRGRYLVRHWFDVIVVIVPLLRPLRAVRSARALRLLRLMWVASLGMKALESARGILAQHRLHYVLAVTGGLVIVAAALVSNFERGAGGSITDFPTALWWAITTITTVGYGDTYPVTAEGRGVGVLVMLIGITVFGLLTANIAAFFVQSNQAKENVSLHDVIRKLDAMQQQVAELQAQIADSPVATRLASAESTDTQEHRGAT